MLSWKFLFEHDCPAPATGGDPPFAVRPSTLSAASLALVKFGHGVVPVCVSDTATNVVALARDLIRLDGLRQ